MKTMKFAGILYLILFFAIRIAQASGAVNDDSHPRPFKATIYYSSASYWTNGTGSATHLGLLTTISSFSDLTDSEGNVLGTAGHDVMTASDGSQLIIDWTATLNADLTEDGTYEITGGTGRFKEVAGSGKIHAFFTPEYDIVLIITGTIIY